MSAPSEHPATGRSPDEQAQHLRRSLSFGTDPEGYDAARPSYPEALVDDLLADTVRARVLDVGCGTGKAGLLFAQRGCAVLGVEADERMAGVAERHGLSVERALFEDWDPKGRIVDLVIAGQAWHWIDPDRGVDKAASVLEPGGRLAPIWNYRKRPPAEIRDRFSSIYDRLAPELGASSLAHGTFSSSAVLERHRAALESSPSFGEPDVRRYLWHHSYDAPSWRALLASHSDHHLLEPGRRERLLDEVERAVEARGGTLEVDYETIAVVSARI